MDKEARLAVNVTLIRVKGGFMIAAIVFTGGGPALFLTSYDSVQPLRFIEKLAGRGIHKFIAYEVDVARVEHKHSEHFEVVIKDLRDNEDVRSSDYNSFNVFHSFSFKELGIPFYHEL